VSHTYVSELIHCVFSTKQRRNLIPAASQPDPWAFIGGVARKNGFKALIVGGTENHVHILLSLPATLTLAKAMQLVKGASSHCMNETFKIEFAWQEGYGAFTIGMSQKSDTIGYIKSQAEHHSRLNFEEEFLAFLKKNGVDYDPATCMGIVSGIPTGCDQDCRRHPALKRRAIVGRPSDAEPCCKQPADATCPECGRVPHFSRSLRKPALNEIEVRPLSSANTVASPPPAASSTAGAPTTIAPDISARNLQSPW
jgi:putative transposase